MSVTRATTAGLSRPRISDAGPLGPFRKASGTAPDIPPKDWIAVVVATRPYRMLDVIPALMRAGFTVLEKGPSDAPALIQQLRPSLVVAAVDPLLADDLEVIHGLAGSPHEFLLLLAPTPDAFAKALDSGADACLCDDDGPDALAAQFGAVRRRLDAGRGTGAPTRVEFGSLVVDFAACKAFFDGSQLPLTPMEFAVFAYLARRPGMVCRPGQIYQTLVGSVYGEAAAAQKLKVHVWRIRRKLKRVGADDDVITNVRGIGYLFDEVPR